MSNKKSGRPKVGQPVATFAKKQKRRCSVMSARAGEELEDLPPAGPDQPNWFRVTTSDALSEEQVDEVSNIISDYLYVNGFKIGVVRLLLDPERYASGELDLRKYLVVKSGQSYEDRVQDRGVPRGAQVEDDLAP
jgi:hypothetical protein